MVRWSAFRSREVVFEAVVHQGVSLRGSHTKIGEPTQHAADLSKW